MRIAQEMTMRYKVIEGYSFPIFRFVIAGLDPAIHPEKMDTRGKPAYDGHVIRRARGQFAMPRKKGKPAMKEAKRQLHNQRGRPKSKSPTETLSLWLDADVVEAYRKTGDGWQTRINADLRKARKLKAG